MKLNKEVHIIIATAGVIAGILSAQGCEMYVKSGVIPVDKYEQSMKMVDRPHGLQCWFKDCSAKDTNDNQGS